MTSTPQAERRRQPTREELDEDLAIPADFDTVLDRIMAGHGINDGNHSV